VLIVLMIFSVKFKQLTYSVTVHLR